MSFKLFSQDTLFFRDGNIVAAVISELNSGIIKYKKNSNINGPLYIHGTQDISKIKFNNGTEKVFVLDVIPVQVSVQKQDTVKPVIEMSNILTKSISVSASEYIKFNITNVFLSQFSFSLEKQLPNKKGFEMELNYNIATPPATSSADWRYHLYNNEQGFEIKPGFTKELKEFRRSSILAGFNVSYRYSHISNAVFSLHYSSKTSDIGVYRMSQTRNLAGVFLKLTYRILPRRNGFDLFVQPGGYFGTNKSAYFGYNPSVNGGISSWTYSNIPEIKTWYLRDGFCILPYINAGASLRFRHLNRRERAEREEREKLKKMDTTLNAKNIVKIKITSLFACKIAIAYEKVFKKRYSWEFEPSFIFPNPIYDAASQFFWPNVWFKNQGFEVRTGINFLKRLIPGGTKTISANAFFISYRYTHNDNVNYWTGGISGKGYHYSYQISQTKNLVGLIYRRSFYNNSVRFGFEPFFELGCYYGFSRTVCFSYAGGYGKYGAPMGVYNVGLPFENGNVFIPVVRIGFDIRCGLGNNKN